MSQEIGENHNKVYKVVLTGGPCGGKTTGQARLCTFFENLGWKVYRAQETALQYLSGGVRFQDLTPDQVYVFQRNIIKTMIQVENTFFDLARTSKQNCLVICDRGVMDASAYITSQEWEQMKKECGWNEIELRDNRYNQIVHMVSAANGAEPFYTVAGHKTRHEGLSSARKLDEMTAQAWVGHPYYDVVDNDTGFETKLTRMIHKICDRLGIDTGDRLAQNSKKRKFLVKSLPADEKFPQYQDFDVKHDYLITPSRKMQARIRKRGNSGYWTYTHTIRKPEIADQCVELKMNIGSRDYQLLLEQKDDKHHTIYKKRRCFLWNNSYFQMDVYQEPCPDVCKGLVLMETFTTQEGSDLKTPDFIEIIKEVTGDSTYSMFYLSLTETWQGRQKELEETDNK